MNYKIQNKRKEDKKMIYDKRIVKAQFINRPNRFYSNVKLDGKEIKVHVQIQEDARSF